MSSYNFIKPRRPQEFKDAQILKAIAKSNGIYLSPKADGVRLQIIINDKAELFIRSREDKPFRGLQGLIETLNQPLYLDYRVDLAGWTFEAEGITVDSNGNEDACATTSGNLQANEQVRTGQMIVALFDLHHPVETKGKDLKERWNHGYQLAQFIELIRKVARQYKPLPPLQLDNLQECMSAYESLRAIGFEGVVLTPIGAPYTSGKKLGTGWKIKPEETKEATVNALIEAVDAEGYPKGMIGSMEVTYEDGTTGKVGAGRMTHFDRLIYWRDPEAIKGRIIEVSSMETNETGGQRHPVFKQFRDSLEFKGVKV